MNTYNLNFISNENLFNHVQETILKYRFKMDLKSFNQNLVDPIKLTFDHIIYQKNPQLLINDEIMRQIDKSNTNHIGYFHQNIFNYLGNGWYVPAKGFDIVNDELKIFVEMKNKHNTMNSSSSQKTYMRMQHAINQDPCAQCFLVEVIAKNSQNIPWIISLEGEQLSDERIRRVSIDHFYHIVTGEKEAFKQLCEILPVVIKDVVNSIKQEMMQNTVFQELALISPNILQSLYLFSFAEYEGFEHFRYTDDAL
ncbi:Eco47II restriction endonuclease [Beggiatoa alba B18LD]|uniref:Eco47II restriction endonuclease n=1 Tax=Beggiatoa alba B18LD TaxID=395493 RepID=I3CKT1_9GAMM|nr:Eco47II family restriction endonuclease [Beggiatoa alba]EIJ44224.1 Eco47II restriction endonuclease [Beggiatoa alba B18LD]